MSGNGYKLLVADIDGTLVGRDGSIREDNKEALAHTRDAGIVVALSTGRALMSSKRILSELELDGYHMFFDGALVCNLSHDEEVYAQPLDEAVLKRAVEFAHANEIDFEFYSRDGYYMERETESTNLRRIFFGVSPTIRDFTTLYQRERIIKGGITATTPEEVAKAQSFHQEFGDSLHCSWATAPTCPEVFFVNVVAPGVTKGKALKKLAAHFGIALEDVVAIGDGNNDISLLTTAGLGIAMGNATPGLKEVADGVTLDVEDGGFCAAVNEFLL